MQPLSQTVSGMQTPNENQESGEQEEDDEEDASPRFTEAAQYGEGDSFGELALIKQQTRSATVVTLEECIFGVIHRDDFKKGLNLSQEKRIKVRVQFLKQLPYFSHWPSYNLAKLQYFFEPQSFRYEEFVYKEGERARWVYIVKEGEFQYFTFRKSKKNEKASFKDLLTQKKGPEVSSTINKTRMLYQRLRGHIPKYKSEKLNLGIFSVGHIFGEEEVLRNGEGKAGNRIFSVRCICMEGATCLAIKHDFFKRMMVYDETVKTIHQQYKKKMRNFRKLLNSEYSALFENHLEAEHHEAEKSKQFSYLKRKKQSVEIPNQIFIPSPVFAEAHSYTDLNDSIEVEGLDKKSEMRSSRSPIAAKPESHKSLHFPKIAPKGIVDISGKGRSSPVNLPPSYSNASLTKTSSFQSNKQNYGIIPRGVRLPLLAQNIDSEEDLLAGSKIRRSSFEVMANANVSDRLSQYSMSTSKQRSVNTSFQHQYESASNRAFSVSPHQLRVSQLSPTFSMEESLNESVEEQRVYMKQAVLKKRKLGLAVSKPSLESPLSIRVNPITLHKNQQFKKRWHLFDGKVSPSNSPLVRLERQMRERRELEKAYGLTQNE